MRPLLLFIALSGAPAGDGSKDLSAEHVHASGAFSFRTPAAWKLSDVPGAPETIQASGDGLLVRFVYRDGESGFDSLHASCMLERLAGPMDTFPQVKYEYDFLSGGAEGYRFLDSAFVVSYDAPILGEREWRQRNVTIVGAGRSLCAISYAPARLWKKSKAVREVLDGVIGSIHLR